MGINNCIFAFQIDSSTKHQENAICLLSSRSLFITAAVDVFQAGLLLDEEMIDRIDINNNDNDDNTKNNDNNNDNIDIDNNNNDNKGVIYGRRHNYLNKEKDDNTDYYKK